MCKIIIIKKIASQSFLPFAVVAIYALLHFSHTLQGDKSIVPGKEVEKKVINNSETLCLCLELELVRTECGSVPYMCQFHTRKMIGISDIKKVFISLVFSMKFINYSTHVNSWLRSIHRPSHHHRRRRHL